MSTTAAPRGERGVLPPWRALAIVAFAGLTQAAAIADPGSGHPLGWLQILSLGVLAGMLDRAGSTSHAAQLGLAYATTWIAGCTWWLYISMHVYGGLPAALAVLAIMALAAFLSIYYALASALVWRLAGVAPAWRIAVFASAWTLAELARGQWLTGFPWGAVGYAHVDGWLAGLAPWVGVYGVGWFAAALAAALALIVLALPRGQRHTVRWGIVCVAVLLVLSGAASLSRGFSRPAGTLSLSLLQGNIPQNEKFHERTGVPMALEWYGLQFARAQGALIVAPETAIPMLPQQLPDGYWGRLTQRFAAGEQAALIGVPLGSFSSGYTNSVLGIAPGQRMAYQYDKHHLVPFGEFIPPLFRWFTDLMNIPLGDFRRGAVGQVSMQWRGQRIAPNICYEDLFGEELGARFVEESDAPTVFVNISNIGWFGNTVAIDQHLGISRMRAIEFERPMVRATNTGATAVIDHQGRVQASLAPYTRAVLEAQVQGREGLTPYALWVSRFGLWPLWLACGSMLVLAWRAIPARTRQPT